MRSLCMAFSLYELAKSDIFFFLIFGKYTQLPVGQFQKLFPLCKIKYYLTRKSDSELIRVQLLAISKMPKVSSGSKSDGGLYEVVLWSLPRVL